MRISLVALVLALASATATADMFQAGPVIKDFGKVALVKSDMKVGKNTRFRVRFDTAERAFGTPIQRTLNTAARFLNMHVRAGMSPSRIDLAVVVHGDAVHDLKQGSGSAKLATALLEHNVQIILCGQSLAFHGLKKGELVPGVKVALSAMTAHALLDAKGYSLNPF